MFMPNRLVNGILQFRPNNWSTDTNGLQLVYGYQFMSNRSANGFLQFMRNNWSTNTTGLQLVEFQFMPNRLVNGFGILQFRPNNWSTNTTGLQLVYEYLFIPNRLANRILQFRPNNWSMNTTGLQLAYEYQFIPNRLANGILQFRPNNWSRNTSLCPTDWSTEFSCSCQTSGLRIPVYAQPIGQRKSPVQTKQLVYEYQFMPNQLVNGILQFRPNKWFMNTSVYPIDLPTEFSSSGQTTGLRIQLVYNCSTNTSLCPIDWSTEFSSSGQTSGLRIPVYARPIRQRKSPVRAKQLVYEYQFMPDRSANGILQFRPNNWSTIPVYAQPIGQRNSPVHAKKLVYEFRFMPNRLVNGILQFRPNKWFLHTSVFPTDWPTEFSSSGQTTDLRIQLVYNWSTNTSLCPIDWSTESSSSGQTSGLRIPVYARPLGQRKSLVRAKQLVYEYQFMTDRLANGILQFRSNNWSTNRTGL